MRRLLSELGESGRTGALHVGGTPGGVFYLVAGRIAYAESPAAPSLAQRLIGSGRLTAQTWRAAYAEGHHGCRVGRVLLRDGWLGQHELAQRVAAAIAGAARVLLRQTDAPARFVPGERHWLGEVGSARAGVRPRRARARMPATGP
ncbi:hypothetical protein Ate01nite_62180 [Actinoplanes teichomyceticus]|nr:hypothetical protein Ate01nite_62180 [Actinoplanes teichomyceticus]